MYDNNRGAERATFPEDGLTADDRRALLNSQEARLERDADLAESYPASSVSLAQLGGAPLAAANHIARVTHEARVEQMRMQWRNGFRAGAMTVAALAAVALAIIMITEAAG